VRIVPWAVDPTAQVIHDCFDRLGRLVPFAPRSVLRRVCDLYAAKGWQPVVAPELEFYLVARNTDPDMPLRAADRPQRPRRDLAPGLLDRRGQRVRPAVRGCLRLLREDGAQRRHPDPRDRRRPDGDQLLPRRTAGLADEVFLFKRTVREAALRHDMYATFMAKPIAGEPGSAMHVHQSILADGKNIFSNEDGRPATSSWYIGGLQRYIPAAMALFAPYVNSYRRLARATAAPINIEWGTTTARWASARRWRRRRRGASRTA
jgi:glutamine synthetase